MQRTVASLEINYNLAWYLKCQRAKIGSLTYLTGVLPLTMLTFINRIIDRCFFTASFVFALQLPEFITSYTSTLSVKLNEAKFQLSQFEKISAKHDQGSVSAMMVRANEQSDVSINSTSELIVLLTSRIANYQLHLTELTANDYLNRLGQFIFNIDWYIAQQTAKQFTLSLPVTQQAITTGLCFAILLLLANQLMALLFKKIFNKTQTSQTLLKYK